MAVVDISPSKDGLDGRGALDLPELMGWAQVSGNLGQKVIYVGRASPGTKHRRICQGRVKAVDVPPETAETAGNDGAVVRGWLLTIMADDRVALVISQLEKVGYLVFIVFLLSAMRVS